MSKYRTWVSFFAEEGRTFMATKALIVVDMLRDFMEEEGALFCGEECRKIIPFVVDTVEAMRKEGAIIIFLGDCHEKDDKEFDMFPPHCVIGTKGAELIKELTVLPGEHFIRKQRYSGFFRTNLEEILASSEKLKEVYLVGVCTSICVMETVADLRNRDYPTFVFRRGVADFDQDAHTFSLHRMEKILGATIID
jgi:nicotinamidase/pyrazinamidase